MLILNLISNQSLVPLVLDFWSNRKCQSFVAMTVILMTTSGTFSSLIELKRFSDVHTAENIVEELNDSMAKWGLVGKVKHVITDNAANLKRAITILNDLAIVDEEYYNDDLPTDNFHDDFDEETTEDSIRKWDLVVKEIISKHRLEHLGCFCHTLHLLINEAIRKCVKLNETIEKIKNWCLSFKRGHHLRNVLDVQDISQMMPSFKT